MDFIVTEYVTFTDLLSDSTLQLTYKKPPLGEFWYNIKEKISTCYLKDY